MKGATSVLLGVKGLIFSGIMGGGGYVAFGDDNQGEHLGGAILNMGGGQAQVAKYALMSFRD